MKLMFIILGLIFCADSQVWAKSFDEVVDSFSKVETIQPVEHKGSPVSGSAKSAMVVCKMAGYSFMTEYSVKEMNLSEGDLFVDVLEGSALGIETYKMKAPSAQMNVLTKVICAK